MRKTYRVTSYDVETGEHCPGMNLSNTITTPSIGDAEAVRKALTEAGYGVVMQEVVETTEATIRKITRIPDDGRWKA